MRPAASLAAGDRGCLPGVATVGADGRPQTGSVQLLLEQGDEADIDGVATDYAAVVTLLCSTSGQCCITNLCNSMSRIEMSFVAMFMSVALALIGVFQGF